MSKILLYFPFTFDGMKRWIIILITIIGVSCHHHPDDLIGVWTVQSKFYSGTYQIKEDGKKLSGVVLYYNDGTSKYTYNEEKPYYIFTGLKKDNGIYIDAVTGATSSNEKPQTLEIQKIHLDTLEVTTYIRNKPLKEIWIRKK